MLKTLKIDDSVCFSHLPQLQRYTGAIDESQRPILLSCLRFAYGINMELSRLRMVLTFLCHLFAEFFIFL